MKPKILVRSALACAAITFASACGSSDSTGPDYDATTTFSDASAVANIGGQMATQMMYSIWSGQLPASPEALGTQALAGLAGFAAAHPAPVGEGKWRLTIDSDRMLAGAIPGTGPRLSTPPGCSTSESGSDGPGGDAIDANLNGFPDDYHLHVTCSVSSEEGGDTVLTESSVLDVILRERAGDLIGFELKVLSTERTNDNHENFQEATVRIESGLSVRSDRAASHQLTLMSMHSHLPGATETTVQETLQRGDASYDPFSPISLENQLPDGKLSLSGEFHAIDTDDDLALRFVLDTPTPLEFDGGCADDIGQPFVDGVLRGRLNGSSNIGFAITFNSCGNEPDYETFGIEDVPVSPRFIAPRFQP